MRAFWLALGFLSTLPVPNLGEVREGEMRQASVFYPAVGYIVGAILAGVGWLSGFLPDGVQGALLLGAWLWLTGMLHLDGLLDSADALLAMKSPSRRLQILSDVHLGSFAFGVGFAVLLLKWQLLASQPHGLALLCIPALVRFALLVPMQLYPAARPEGLGARAKEGRVWAALLWALPAIVLMPWVALGVLLAMLGVARFAAARLGGGLSGDVYGAMVEIGETVGLLLALALTLT